MKNICVFCSSSNEVNKKFFKDAKEMGHLIGQAGFDFVYGGSTLGLMGESAKGAREKGSKIIGIMPQKLCDYGVSSGNCDEFYITEGMRERKAKLDELSDAVIALPGGFGTLEEISEIIVQKHLGYSNKPIVFLNTLGFYNNLFDFFNQIVDKNFAQKSMKKAYYIANTPKEAIDYIINYKPDKLPTKFEDIYVGSK